MKKWRAEFNEFVESSYWDNYIQAHEQSEVWMYEKMDAMEYKISELENKLNKLYFTIDLKSKV